MPPPIDHPPAASGQLSPAQERMWLLAQLDPLSPAYSIPVCAWLNGPLDAERLRLAWRELAQLHDVLRTRFPLVDGVPVCEVAAQAHIDFTLVEPGAGTLDEREHAALALAQEEVARTFDLAARPPWRILLVRVAAGRHLLAVAFHLIGVDGASLPRLFNDLASAYAGLLDEGSAAGGATYRDFTAWQRAFLGSARCAEQLAYWQHTLAELEPLNLPIDRPRPRQPTSNGARLELPLEAELIGALAARARELGVSDFALLLASFAALIQRCTLATDLPIATQVDNRATAGSAAPSFLRLVGMCINTVIIRAGCSGEQPFGEVARAVDAQVGAALRHADVPFDRVVGTQRGGGGQAGHAPANLLFDVETPRLIPRLALPGVEAEIITIDNRTAMFDLVVSLHLAGSPSCSVRYSTDLFAEETIRRLLMHFRELLSGVAADPRTRICDLPLLSRAEFDAVTVEWNRTAHDVPTDICIHQLFATQALLTPERTALVYDQAELSYRQLNQHADRLARQLSARGVGPEVLVGVLLDRSPALIIAVLAVLKAGGAYVPCDRKMTRSRIAYLVQDAKLRLVLTQADLAALLPDGVEQLAVPPLAVGAPAPPAESAGEPLSGVQAGNAAYVIYTSGSTGEPKGVVVEHRSAVNAIIATIARYAELSCDRTLFQSSITFDSSVTKIFQSLCHGGTLYLAPEGADFEQALALTALHRIPRLTTTPSELATLNATPERLPAHLEMIGAAGENLTLGDVDRIIERIPILNIYGPTETTISTTCFRLTRDYPLAGGTVPIGKPIMNYRVYVLDRALKPMPIGCTGELCIAGIGVARGYLHAPELTAQRFVPDPFTLGGRLYRSGDLARWLPDGNLEFKGRVDQQVKIRGYRIELGEIEHALGRHPQVRHAVVLARQAKPVGAYLVAYVVMSSPTAPVEALRDFLAETLPDYMVPARFMRLDDFPRQVSGKIDRKALPEPDWSTRTLARAATAPRNRREELLVQIWAQVLGVNEVGVDDSFFALGGDSIISLQIIARANQAGLRLTLRQLFQERTVARLAGVAQEVAPAGPASAEQGTVSGEVVLTPIQRWFLARGLKHPQQWNMTSWLEAVTPIDRAALATAVRTLLRHHDALRLRYRYAAGGWVQRHGEAEQDAELVVVDLAGADAQRQNAELEALANRLNGSLDLADGPLVRVAHADLGGGRSTLLVVVHHLVIDGVSWRVLVEDLNAGYLAAAAGRAIALPAKSMSFKSWAERLVAHAATAAVASEAAYWLAAVPAQVRRLPRDYDGSNVVGDTREVVAGLDRDETAALLQQVPAAFRTQVNEVLLTALVQALAPWSGEAALLVELEGHGREDLFADADISRTVGWFTTMYPVWLDLRAGAGAETCLSAVKEQLRGVPDHGIGYGLLSLLGIDPAVAQRLASQPAPEISFNYLGQFTQAASGQATWRWSSRARGPTRHPEDRRIHILEIVGMVQDGQLNFTWIYSEKIHRQSTIAGLATAFCDRLRELIRISRSAGTASHAPSDFPMAKLDQGKLDKLLATLSKKKQR